VAARLRPGDVVYVRGELGSGKTVFVRGACRTLGVSDPVTSPTYTIGNSYRGVAGPVSHLDLYRSAGVTLDEWADLEPYFDGATVFVEWPEAGAGILPSPRITVTMRICEGDARLIVLETNDRELTAALADPEP
jgi:tRNA threonylcarbamoyladenosine biosynthesis protein TsaE